MRVVLDTNIYISALAIPGKQSEKVLKLALENTYTLIISPSILAELANVLHRKFQWTKGPIQRACKLLAEISIVVNPQQKLSILQDEPDNRILECAIEGQAIFVVTGDRKMLELKNFQGIQIITLHDFLTPYWHSK